MIRIVPTIIGILSAVAGFSQVQVAGSYLNITRPSGGPVATGDVLEIRAVISIPSGTNITKLNYISTVPTGSSFISGSLKVITNEGIVVAGIPNTGSYTDAAGDDVASITGGGITINMGTGATQATGGAVNGGSTTPVFNGTASIFMTAYRVTITAAMGSTIAISGSFRYKDASATNITKNLPAASIIVSPFFSCSSSGVTNLLTTETNGTFGSGNTLNRSSSASVTGFTFQNLAANAPQDGNYSIVNNTSPTQYTGSTPAAGDKVFTAWDVLGNHGTGSGSAGNPPAAAGATGGYMLVVNASFAPAVVYTSTISGLTANTNYTLSFWLRNICAYCGFDPTSGNANGTPGVRPNLAFDINGVNYFSTGNMIYTGQWVNRSFTFNTGILTSVVLTIKNNAPGGGGNDWAIDDLSLTQCLVILPMQISHIQGQRGQNAAVISWQAAGEQKGGYYDIERSTGNGQFVTIGRVNAGMQHSDNTYYFTDYTRPLDQDAYYRLRAAGSDDASAYSEVVLIKAETTPLKISRLAPNPARSSTVLYMQADAAGTAVIDILNMAGNSLCTQTARVLKGMNAISISLPGQLPPGLYLVSMYTAGKTIYSRLVIE